MTNKASAVELLEEQKYTISPDIMKAFVCEMQVYRAAIKEMQMIYDAILKLNN